MELYNENEQEGQNTIQYVQSEDKGTMGKLVLEPRLAMKPIELFKSCSFTEEEREACIQGRTLHSQVKRPKKQQSIKDTQMYLSG